MHRLRCALSLSRLRRQFPRRGSGKRRRNERLRCELSACLLISRCGGSFPQGKLGGCPISGLYHRGATFLSAVRPRGPSRARDRATARWARNYCKFRRKRVQREGRLVKPFSLAILSPHSFCSHRKNGPPEDVPHVPEGRYLRPVKNEQLQSKPFGLSLFRRPQAPPE